MFFSASSFAICVDFSTQYPESASLLSPEIEITEESCFKLTYVISSSDITLTVTLESTEGRTVTPEHLNIIQTKKVENMFTLPPGKYAVNITVIKWNEMISSNKQVIIYKVDVDSEKCPILGMSMPYS